MLFGIPIENLGIELRIGNIGELVALHHTLFPIRMKFVVGREFPFRDRGQCCHKVRRELIVRAKLIVNNLE